MQRSGLAGGQQLLAQVSSRLFFFSGAESAMVARRVVVEDREEDRDRGKVEGVGWRCLVWEAEASGGLVDGGGRRLE